MRSWLAKELFYGGGRRRFAEPALKHLEIGARKNVRAAFSVMGNARASRTVSTASHDFRLYPPLCRSPRAFDELGLVLVVTGCHEILQDRTSGFIQRCDDEII